MSSRMCTVTFLRLSDGPVSLTSLRLKVSPDSSRKNTRKMTMVAWLRKPTRPSEPAQTQSMILKLGASAAAARRLLRRVSAPAATCSISLATACIFWKVLFLPPVLAAIRRDSLCVAAGNSSMIDSNSPCTRSTTTMEPNRIRAVTAVAPMARGRRSFSSQATTGLRV